MVGKFGRLRRDAFEIGHGRVIDAEARADGLHARDISLPLDNGVLEIEQLLGIQRRVIGQIIELLIAGQLLVQQRQIILLGLQAGRAEQLKPESADGRRRHDVGIAAMRVSNICWMVLITCADAA